MGIIVQTMALENKRGFTIIELVIVIVLIGILAATVLPKFANLSLQAELAVNQAFAGELGVGASVAHAAWVFAGSNTTTFTTVTMDTATSVYMNTHGWPAGSANGAAPFIAADCFNLVSSPTAGVMSNPPAIAGAGSTIATCGSGAGANGICYLAVGVVNQGCPYNLWYNGTQVFVNGNPVTVTYNGKTGAVTTSP